MKNIRNSLMVMVFIMTGILNIQAENVYPTNGVNVNSATFFLGANYTTNDGLPASTTYGKTRGIVTLGIDWGIIDHNAVFTVDSSYVIDVLVGIIGWNPTVSSPNLFNASFIDTTTLRLIYHPEQNVTEIDKAVYTRTNIRQLYVSIATIKINGVPVTSAAAKLPQSLYLTTDLEVERYKTFNTATTPSLSSITNLNNNQLRVTWGSITGAEDYDVEWTWVDALAPQNYDFTHNSSRVTVPASSGTSYIIPNAYPNGKIVIRVRGRGRDLTIAPDFSRHTFGTWSIAAAGALSGVTSSTFTISTGLEEEKNWQYTTTFSEQGKRQDVIQYFDGTLRNRQSITRLNVLDSAALVGETFYDHIGRPSVQVLPVPHVDTDTSYNHLFYRELFNRDVNDQQFTYEDFDTNDSNNCDGLIVNPMSIDYGASYYYSENNPLQSTTPGNIYNYLPKAQGFPYTQIEYMPDNTNRVRRQSGVGVTHRLTGTDVNDSIYTGKETKYYYGTPFQVQLDRLFGSEVGRYKHYKKNLVIDANGQISVSYIDPYGRIIATALAGDTVTTPNLLPLASSNSSANLDCNLLDSMQIDYNNMSILATATHLVTSPGIHSFSYSVATPSYHTCLPVGWCFDCVYDLTISIKDECGIELVDDSISTQMVGSIDTTCDSITFTLAPDPLQIDFQNPGNYVITKILKVNQEALDYYTEMFLENSPCILPLDSFIADAMNDIDTTECYGGCQDCLDRLGDYSEHNDTSQRFDADYDYMTMDEYDHALEVCNSLCDMPTPCDALYKQIIADVSPGGQYMEYDLSGYTYTVDDTLSLLNISLGALGNYTEVTTYEDSDGSPSVISIDGLTYNAENLPVNLFLQHWQESWAASLAPLHPEYCYYEACAANEDSYTYDNNMLLTSTFEAARDSGFLNPIGSNTDTVPFHIEHKDPFFAPYSGTLYTSMLNALDDYVGVDTTAWELIELMQNTNNSYSGNGDCWTDYDWGLFRTAYLSTKQTFLQAMYDGLSNCANFGSYPNNPFSMGTKTPRFIFNAFDALGDENLTGYDLTTNSGSSPQSIQDEALSHIDEFCDTLCTSYAETWMYNLMGCGMSDPDSVEIRNRLIAACKGNCNGTTPLGGIEEAQVADILEDVLGPSYADADCNPLSIVQPVDHGPGAFGMVPADSCACDKVLNAHVQFDTLTATGNLPMGICSEQDMFTYLYGPDANGVNFDELECYCLSNGFIDEDTIVTSSSSGPVTTIIAPDCDLFNQYYYVNNAQNFMNDFFEFFESHWNQNYCLDDTTILINSIPGNFGLKNKCFTEYTIDNTYGTAITQYFYVNPVTMDTLQNCELVDSLYLYPNPDSIYYFEDSLIFNPVETQHITLINSCTGNCELIVSAIPDSCFNGYLGCGNYLPCRDGLVLFPRDDVKFDSISYSFFCDTNISYVSTWGPGLYAVVGGSFDTTSTLIMSQSKSIALIFWTSCFLMDTPMVYVPASLACEQCMTCSTFVDGYTQLFTDYPFVSGLFADDSTYNIGVHYIADYINDLYNQNFSIYQIDQFNRQCMSSGDPDTLELCYEPMFTTYNDPHQECVDFLIATALSNAENNYHAYIDSVSASFRQEYITKCLGAFETFNMDYTEREFHYTLYYYDQAGNLIKTVPPEGVSVITDTLILDSVELHRNHPLTYPNRVIPDHELITDYRYTTLNQPARQHTPDGGITQYWYDILGRLVVSQSAKQAGYDLYSYTKYDDLGRIIEVGEVQHDTAMTPAHAANIAYLTSWLNAGTKTQVTSTYYDATVLTGMPFTAGVQKNLRNRVAYTTFEETYDGTDTIYDVATHYSYDIHGNVFELVQDVLSLTDQGARFKLVQYSYDLISGKVLEVKYQHGEKDQFYHKYEYTHDNKLTKAKTSRDQVIWDEDASYQYYMYGALARTEMGDNNVQGVDNAYTIHGWIKGTNSNTLTSSRDIGKDGYKPTSGPANAHQNFCIDVAAFSLGYYRQTNGAESNDYQPIGSFADAKFFIAKIDTSVIATNQASLFNGNISHMVTTIPNCSTFTASQTFSADPLGTVYRYDQLNRIKWMKAYSDPAYVGVNNHWQTTSSNNGKTYHSNFKYDANGNLTNLGRWGNRSDSLLMDSLTYGYSTSSDPYYSGQQINRLDTIAEHQNSRVRYNNDIDNDSYYSYDEIGNLTEDTGEEIDEIEWTVYGKVRKVTRVTGSTKPDLEFKYNSSGQRYCKIVKPRNSSGLLNQGNYIYTYYVHDAQGNILTTYTIDYQKNDPTEYMEHMKVSAFMLYGSSRLGLKNDTVLVSNIQVTVGLWNGDSTWNSSFTPQSIPALDTSHTKRITGFKNYEISNHLGNVLATITDRKVAIPTAMDTIVDYWTSDINTLTDYYPFGSEMPGRNLMITNCGTATAVDTFKVVDEQFASGTGGFTALITASLSNVGSKLQVTTTCGSKVFCGGGAKKTFSQINGVVYTVTFSYGNGTCSTNTLTCIVRNASSTAISTQTYTTAGVKTFSFTANQTGTGSIEFTVATACTFTIDTVVISYPYSQVIADCGLDTNSYMFGFNGKEKVNETYGEGNAYDFGARIYDPRICRWLAIDPLEYQYPDLSPYSYSYNSPLIFYDIDGMEIINGHANDLQDAKTALTNYKKGTKGYRDAKSDLQKVQKLYNKADRMIKKIEKNFEALHNNVNNLTDENGTPIDVYVFAGSPTDGTSGETSVGYDVEYGCKRIENIKFTSGIDNNGILKKGREKNIAWQVGARDAKSLANEYGDVLFTAYLPKEAVSADKHVEALKTKYGGPDFEGDFSYFYNEYNMAAKFSTEIEKLYKKSSPQNQVGEDEINLTIQKYSGKSSTVTEEK